MQGSGTIDDPYIIMTLDDLDDIHDDLDAYYELGANINAYPAIDWDSGKGWDPLGKSSPYFGGYIDGKGYYIEGLYIDRDEVSSYIGFIGTTDGVGGHVSNLRLLNATVKTAGTNNNYLGIMCGMTGENAVFTNCGVSGQIDTGINDQTIGGMFGWLWRSSASRCWANVAIITQGAHCGGFAGHIYGCSSRDPYYRYVERCLSLGTINRTISSSNYIGGFTAMLDWGAADPQDSYLENCFSLVDSYNYDTGDWVSGGFIGAHGGDATYDTILKYCYAAGIVNSGVDIVGGFAQILTQAYADITSCFWDTEKTGQATSDGGTGKTTAEMKDPATFTAGGYDFDVIWSAFSHCNAGYPCLIGVQGECQSMVGEGFKDHTLAPDKVILEAIRNLEIVYGGRFLISRDGKARYESRYRRNV